MSFSAKHCCLAVAISLSLGALPALAQQAAASYTYTLNLPEQPLKDSLLALGKATHVNIVFDPAVVAGRRAPVLRGQYTSGEALQRLLAGSGLSALQTPGGSYTVEPSRAQGGPPSGTRPANSSGTAADASSTNTFDTVVVTAKVGGFSATRMPTALKDIPQSLTVIDQQTLREQNANALDQALKWAPGITLQKSDSTNTDFYSRGFLISNFHIDGSAQLKTSGLYSQLRRLDLSQYESIEVLRGADALFGGTNYPGGSINLTRKRPQAEASTGLTASAGSWDNYRIEADVNTGSITDSGRLRARVVAVTESEHYFFDTAKRNMNKLYAIGEYDLRPNTQVRLGGVIERTPDYVAFTSGLPRYADGRDPQLPRSAALTFPWAKNNSTRKESFLQLDHAFNERWKLKASAARIEQDQDSMPVQSLATIDPVSRTLIMPGPGYPSAILADTTSLGARQTTADLTLMGSFDWNGRVQEIALGFDGSRMNSQVDSSDSFLLGPPIDLSDFDPSNYPARKLPFLRHISSARSREYGVFASIKLRPADGWAITAGARDSSSRVHSVEKMSLGSLQLPTAVSGRSLSGLVTPYLGVVYEISPTYSLYASYADVTEGAGTTFPHRTADGKLLDPSRGTNRELGLKAAWDKGRLNGSLALFDIDKIDIPASDPRAPAGLGPDCCYLPTTAHSKGFEAELSGLLASGWMMSAGYTFNLNRAGDGTMLSTVTPKHLLKLWTNYRFPGSAQDWEIGGGITAQSKNYNEGSACKAFDPTAGRCGGEFVPFRAEQGFYSVATLRVGYRMNERWNLALNVDNLFDRRYYQTVRDVTGGNWYGAPRNWMLTLRGEL